MTDLKQSTAENQKKKTKPKKTKRILIAEPEPDIRYLYSLFTKQYGFSISDVSIVESGDKCLEIVFSNIDDDNNNNDGYDIIILDTHLHDISGFDVARKIRNRLPHKKIILTTTYSLDNINSMIDSIGIKNQDLLFKPFSYSDLVSFKRTRNIIQLITNLKQELCYHLTNQNQILNKHTCNYIGKTNIIYTLFY
jgi:DNA-binding response OmpR family regulator